jgi:GNAT superfamily N-acetyltransferase
VTAEIVKLKESWIGEAGAVLARAFHDDPLTVYAMPNAADRTRLMPEYYARMVRFGCLAGEVHTTAGTMEGVAVWLSPGAKWTREKVEASGLHELSGILGAPVLGRMREVWSREAHVRERDMKKPYWYLLLLGVEPARHRRGLGGALMQPMLDRAASEGLTCYLETELKRNVRFYLDHGFELIVEAEAAGTTGVRFWTFQRRPPH